MSSLLTVIIILKMGTIIASIWSPSPNTFFVWHQEPPFIWSQRATTSGKGIRLLTACTCSNPVPSWLPYKICLLCEVLITASTLRDDSLGSLSPNKPFFLHIEWSSLVVSLCPCLHSPLHSVVNNHITLLYVYIKLYILCNIKFVFFYISQLERNKRSLFDLLVFITNLAFVPLKHPFSMPWNPLYHKTT